MQCLSTPDIATCLFDPGFWFPGPESRLLAHRDTLLSYSAPFFALDALPNIGAATVEHNQCKTDVLNIYGDSVIGCPRTVI